MNKIELKAYGKINLGLDVIRKREDGYHDLDMIMQTVGVYDDVVINKEESGIVVTTDTNILSNDKGNLAYIAAKTLIYEFKIEEGVRIHINKRIPIAGGMAGGSADCAATLRGINVLFDLGLSDKELQLRGVKLGADVPYCVIGGTARAQGIGDKLTSVSAPPQCYVMIAKPDIYVSTQYVYSHIRPEEITRRPDIDGLIKSMRDKNLNKMSSLLENVMEEVTTAEYPVINKIKQVMLESGALNAIMSGSGPTVFGLFDDKNKADYTMQIIKNNNLASQLYLTKFIQDIFI